MTVRQPSKSSLRELFDRVKHVRYAVISPWKRLPMEVVGVPIILTDDLHTLSSLWNLTMFNQKSQYSAQPREGHPLVVTILEKGRNVFPETFESVVLARRILHQESVYVPDDESWPLLRLYWKIFYEEFMTNEPEDRRMMLDWLTQKVGSVIRPKYRWLNYNKDISVKQVSSKFNPESMRI